MKVCALYRGFLDDNCNSGAKEDARNNTQDACEEWNSRINSDILFVSEVVAIQRSKLQSSTLHLRKKNEFDVNRAKAILKADQRALRKAFPNYSGFKKPTSSSSTSPVRPKTPPLNENSDSDDEIAYKSRETDAIIERHSGMRKSLMKVDQDCITANEGEVIQDLLKEFLG